MCIQCVVFRDATNIFLSEIGVNSFVDPTKQKLFTKERRVLLVNFDLRRIKVWTGLRSSMLMVLRL